MVQSIHSLVAISINGYYHSHLLYHHILNDHEISLVINVQGKNISRK